MSRLRRGKEKRRNEMITVVRLRERDKRKGYLMATYVSAATRTRYSAGNINEPSPLRIVESKSELAELKDIDQFEILEFEDKDELQEFIQTDMERRARSGLTAIRAQIQTGTAAAHDAAVAAPRKTALDKIPAAAKDKDDPTKSNTGRKPEGAAGDKTDMDRPGEDDEPEKPARKPKPDPKKRAVVPAKED